MEGALVHKVKAGFVAVEEGELGGCGKGAEGGGKAGEIAGGGLRIELGGEKAGLDGPGAAKTPVGGGHFLDHAEFDAIDRTEAVEVGSQEIVKTLAGLAGENHTFGQEAVGEGVGSGNLLTFGSLGTSGKGAVGAGREDSAKRAHRWGG